MTMDSDRNLGFKIVNIPKFKSAHTGIYNVVRSWIKGKVLPSRLHACEFINLTFIERLVVMGF